MKKIVLAFSVLAIAGTVFVSCCKKGNYTCTCTEPPSEFSVGASVAVPLMNMDEKSAQDQCSGTIQMAQAPKTCVLTAN